MIRSVRLWISACLLVVAFLCCGCGIIPKPDPTVYLKPCTVAKPDPNKTFPADSMTTDMSIFDKVKLLLADREERKIDRVQYQAITEACH